MSQPSYPSLKPLPKVEHNDKTSKAFVPKGMIRKATYERRKFEAAFQQPRKVQ